MAIENRHPFELRRQPYAIARIVGSFTPKPLDVFVVNVDVDVVGIHNVPARNIALRNVPKNKKPEDCYHGLHR